MLFLDSALARRNTVVGCTWLFLEKILQLHFRGGQAPIPVRLCAGQTGTKLTLLARLCATGGATNRHRFFRLDFHDYIMRADLISVWSIVTTGSAAGRNVSLPRRKKALGDVSVDSHFSFQKRAIVNIAPATPKRTIVLHNSFRSVAAAFQEQRF